MHNDFAHRLDDDLGKFTDGGLSAKHHRIGTIEHRVGYVVHFGPRGAWGGNHAFQHLGRDDDRLGGVTAFFDNHFLQYRNVFHRHFHTEVAPGHHDAIG